MMLSRPDGFASGLKKSFFSVSPRTMMLFTRRAGALRRTKHQHTLFWLILLVLASTSLHAEIDYPITPESLQQQVELRSLAEVHDELFSHPYAMNMVLLAIDSAEPEWLDIAELLLKEQNPVSGPRLIMALGEGLQWQPGNVLTRSFPLQRICSLDGLYEWRRFSLFLVDTAIQRRLKALDKLAATDEVAAQCQQSLLRIQRGLTATMNNRLPDHRH